MANNRIFCYIILFLILSSDFSLVAYAQQPQPTAGQVLQEYAETPAPKVSDTKFSCETVKIPPQEAQNIKKILMGDNDEEGNPINGTAFVGKESRSMNLFMGSLMNQCNFLHV